MAYVKVSKEFVVKHAKFMILKIDHIDAIEADKIIDKMMKMRVFFGTRPRYSSRTECIKEEQGFEAGSLHWAFYSRKQKLECERLLLAAQNCIDDHLYLSDKDISALGFNAESNIEYIKHFWNFPND